MSDSDKDVDVIEDYSDQDIAEEILKISNADPKLGLHNLVTIPNNVQTLIEDPTVVDPLYQSIKNDKSDEDIFKKIMLEYAEELAYLRSYRKQNFSLDIDKTSSVTEKRIKALEKLVDAISKRYYVLSNGGKGKIDFNSESFTRVFQKFLEQVQETFKKVGIPEQYSKIFFPELAKKLDGFEKIAEKVYYGRDR